MSGVLSLKGQHNNMIPMCIYWDFMLLLDNDSLAMAGNHCRERDGQSCATNVSSWMHTVVCGHQCVLSYVLRQQSLAVNFLEL